MKAKDFGILGAIIVTIVVLLWIVLAILPDEVTPGGLKAIVVMGGLVMLVLGALMICAPRDFANWFKAEYGGKS